MSALSVVLLVVSCLALILACSFLMSAVLIFAAHDQKPLDRETDRALLFASLSGGSGFVQAFIVARCWRQSRLGRRLFYAGVVSGVAAIAAGWIAAARG